jgi:hypothetical protein
MELRIVDFEGLWHVDRDIDDRLTGRKGAFLGFASLRPGEGGLWLWSESGALHLGEGPHIQAGRRYLWREKGDRIAVLFEDGRPFHDFLPGGAPEAAHRCAPDDYRVRYDFLAWPAWHATWVVRGSRKDYSVTSRYSPAGAGS